jgi:HlyD family secretion protein
MKFNKKWLAAALVVGVIAVPMAVKRSRAATGLEVDMTPAAEREIRPTILASGTLAYRTEVSLTSELVAKVAVIAVKEGDTVAQGQLLLKLDPESYRNVIEQEEASKRQSSISIERQRAALSLREKQFERSRKLIDAKMIDQNGFDETRNQLELARVDVRSSEEALRRADAVLSQAREQLAKTEVRSPIAGTVVDLPIKVGETAIPSTSSLAGAQLMMIADTSAIQAELKVDEADIATIATGQQANVYAAAYPDIALKGRVERIALAPTIEGQGRAYKVTVALSVPKNVQLRSGMSARADIFLSDGKKKLSVPLEAIGSDVGEDKRVTSYVWLQKDGRARKVAVETGVSDDQWEEVGKSVAQGDVVVVGPAKTLRLLRDGDVVSQRQRKDNEDSSEDSADQGAAK